MRLPVLALLLAVPALSQTADDTCAIAGRVTRSGSTEGLRKATVALFREGGMKPLVETGTDFSGQYCFTGIVPGFYRVSAEQAGFVKREYGARRWQERGTTLVVQKGEPVTANLELLPRGGIRGRVNDGDGDAVPGARVSALRIVYERGRRDLQRAAEAECDEGGEYKLANLAPGRYLVRAIPRLQPPPPTIPGRPPQPGMAYGPTFYPASPDAANATIVEVQPAIVPDGVNVILRRAQLSRIRGRVMRYGQPATGASVVLGELTAGAVSFRQEFAQKVNDADGTFDFRGIWGTQYLVQARDGSGSDLEGSLVVDASGRDVDFVNIYLGERSSINGVVTFPDAPTPMSRAYVEFEPVDSFLLGSPRGRVDAEGRFSIPRIGAGRYWVSVRGLPDSSYVRAVRVGSQELIPPVLEIRHSGRTRLEIVISSRAATVTGRVTTPSGSASGGAPVCLIPEARNQLGFRAVYAQPDGAFAITGLAPGDYTLVALEDWEPGTEQEPDFLTRYGARARRISLPEGGTLSVDLVAAN